MSRDSFDIISDKELQSLENDMSQFFEDLEPVPVRESFAGELRSRLQAAMDNMPRETEKKPFFFKSFLAGIKKGVKMPSFTFGQSRAGQRNLKLVASFALVVFMFTALFWGLGELGPFLKPVQAGEIRITAIKQDKAGVDTDSAFLLTSQNPLDERTVEEILSISPKIDYKLEKKSGGREYRIVPQEQLAPNTVYKFTFDVTQQERDSYSWAFQTKGQFRVISSLPGNNTAGVPVNTGIEIVFSHDNFALEQAGQYVSISPQVEGRFEKHKKTLVFVPKALQNSTVYTVTVKKGFPLAGSSQALAEDYQFTFETQAVQEVRDKFTFDLHGYQAEFTADQAPVFPVFFYWQGKVPQAQITVYRYPDSIAFIADLAKISEIPYWAYNSRNNYRADLSKLAQHSRYTADFISADRYSHYLVLPEPLPAGFYAVQIQAGEAVKQVWVQVSNLGVYVTQSMDSGLFWVNDLSSGQPVKGAKISLAGQAKSWQTDDNGVAHIKEKLAAGQPGFVVVESGAQATVVPLEALTGSAEAYHMNRDYWKYLYLDRELYKPGDTVHFWGIFSPRQGAKALSELTLELRSSEGPYYEGAENSPILTQQVAVKGHTYTGEMKLPVLKTGYYYLVVKAGEVELLSRSFSVETYAKPGYQLTIEQDKKAIFAGERVNFQVRASFFEGTPVPDLSLNYYTREKNGTVVTDQQGIARISYEGIEESEYSPYGYGYLSVSASSPEAGEIYASSQIYVFRSKMHLAGEVKRQGSSYTLQVKTQHIDLTRINQGQDLNEENFLQGPAPYTQVTGKVFKDIWEKYEAGQYYDYINKRVQTRYEYRHSVQEVGELSLTTGSDGTAVYTGQLDDEKASYYIELTAQDQDGRSAKRHVPIYGSSFRDDPIYNYYYLQDQRTGGYHPGETVRITFMVNDQPLAERKQGFLYYQARKDLESYAVANESSYNFVFNEYQLPNTVVYGVYFDGRTYQEANMVIVALAKESKELKVTVTSDRQEYRPGEKVKLEVLVTDRDKRPVQAEVNLNLVDEALFSMTDQQVNLLQSLYGDYIIPQLRTWRSHNQPGYGGGAEKGGEGGGERKDFRDTVLFTTLTTGKDGKAGTEFTLPDNLTSWRVTYHALADGLQAASGTAKIPVRLPFFVEITMNENYHAGDQPVLLLRAYGEKLSSGQPVTYQITLVDPSGKEIKGSGQGTAFIAYDYQLPVLSEGLYKLTVKGQSGSYEDIISRPITVRPAVLERTVTQQLILSSETVLEGSAQKPTTIIFSDYEKSQYLRGLYDLAWVHGSRIEQELAAREARKLLRQYFPDNEWGQWAWEDEEESSLLRYQQPDGGISILPYSESELALSALVATYSPGDFDRRALAGYFYRILEGEDSKEDDRTLALWGLAALDQPMLLQIRSELERTDLEPEEKIRLAMALLECGDGAYGKEVFRKLIQQYGEDLGTTMRIKGGKDQDEIVAATTQMALLAARLEEPEKGKLFQYILENPGQEFLNTLEKLQILKYSLKYMRSEPVSFTYELNGQKVSKTLKNQEVFGLTLLPADLAGLKFNQVQGKVGVTVVYSAPLQPGEQAGGEDLKLARTYYVGNKYTGGSLGRGDLVQVVLSYEIGDKAPNGPYEIVDILPAGLAYVNRPYTRKSNFDRELAYPSEVNGQQLTFTVWKGQGQGKLLYYARVITPGEYQAGAPYLGSISNNTIYLTGSKDRVVIK